MGSHISSYPLQTISGVADIATVAVGVVVADGDKVCEEVGRIVAVGNGDEVGDAASNEATIVQMSCLTGVFKYSEVLVDINTFVVISCNGGEFCESRDAECNAKITTMVIASTLTNHEIIGPRSFIRTKPPAKEIG